MANDDVSVKFGGSTDELNSAVDSVKSKIQEISDPVDQLSQKFTALGEAFIAAFSLDKISGFIEGLGEAAEQLQRLETISGLSGDTIQTLQFAMQRTGGDANTATMLMTRFGRSVEEAASGTGPAYEAFQKLHVGLSSLRHDDISDVFNKAVEGFKNLDSTTARSEVGIQLFSRAYANVAGAFAKGTEGLEEARAHMQALGNTMNELRQSSFEALDQDIKDMKDAWQGLGAQLVDAALPAIRAIVEALSGLALMLREIVQELQLATEGFKAFFGLEDRATAQRNTKEILNTPDARAPKPADANRGADAQAAQQKALQQQFLEDQMHAYQEDYENFVATESLKVARGDETKDQQLAAQIRFLKATEDLEDTTLDKEIALQQQGTAEYQKLTDEKLLLNEKFATEVLRVQTQQADLAQQEVQKQVAAYAQGFNEIGQDYDKLVSSFFTRSQSMGQEFQKFAQDMVIQFTEAVSKMIIRWTSAQLFMAAGWNQMAGALGYGPNAGKGGAEQGQNSIMNQLITAVTGLFTGTAANTVATTANTAGLASNTAADEASGAAGGAGGGGGFFSGVGGFLSSLVPSAEGTPYVPKDMPAFIHQGEMIIPRAQSESLRSGQSSLGGGDQTHVHFNISSLDSAGVTSMMKRHSSAISSAVVAAARGGHGELRNALGRM